MEIDEIKIKCVLVINPDLPIGLIANTAAILGLTLGNKVASIIGEDVMDASNQIHLGITNIPIPILKGTKEKIKELSEQIKSRNCDDLIMVDFSNIAQTCTEYDDYIVRASKSTSDMFEYFGIGIYGVSKKVNKLTGSMPLLR